VTAYSAFPNGESPSQPGAVENDRNAGAGSGQLDDALLTEAEISRWKRLRARARDRELPTGTGY
jgi:hypothetical protein